MAGTLWQGLLVGSLWQGPFGRDLMAGTLGNTNANKGLEFTHFRYFYFVNNMKKQKNFKFILHNSGDRFNENFLLGITFSTWITLN